MNLLAVKLAGGAVAALALAVLAGQALDRWGEMKAAAACVGALSAGELARADAACPKRLAEDARRAAAARVCDAGLADPKAGRFAVRQACSAPVKQVVAERDAAADQVADLTRRLQTERAAQAAATARAVARARDDERTKARAQAALSSAPRTAGGAVVCDAGCLRALAGA